MARYWSNGRTWTSDRLWSGEGFNPIPPVSPLSITTYAELQSAMAQWLGTATLNAVLPDFIALCEADFTRDLRIMTMEESTDITVDAEEVALPTGWRGNRRFYLDTTPRTFLRYLSPEQFHDRYRGTPTGRPQHYTLMDDEFVFGPAPDTSYTGKLVYWKAFTPLSTVNTTNDMLSRHPDLYLFGSLMKAELYVQNDPRAAVWRAEYARVLGAIMAEDRRDRVSGSVAQPSGRGPYVE